MAEIITDGSQKELKKHGSDEFPLLVSYEKLSGYKSGSFLWHWHPEIEITLVLDGQILYKVNQCTYHMKAGDILLGNANVLHAGFMEDMKDGKYVSITFLPKIIYGSYGSILRRKYVEPFLHNFSLPAVYIDYSQPWHEIFSEYVREIITLYEEKKEFYELDITGTLQKLWRCMLQNLPENLPYTEPANWNATVCVKSWISGTQLHEQNPDERYRRGNPPLRERMQPVIQEIHERIPVYISAGIPGGTEP